jgi:hypothetical protein
MVLFADDFVMRKRTIMDPVDLLHKSSVGLWPLAAAAIPC